jgi:ATP-dependent DNA helicase RecQ
MVDSWEGVDRELFDVLRRLRREIATERGVPAYIVFGDATLRDMARRRPSSREKLLEVHGVGERKAADFGTAFIECIAEYCSGNGVAMDVEREQPVRLRRSDAPTAGAIDAFPLFEEALRVEEAAERLGRAVSTTYGYLEAYVKQRGVTDVTPWVTRGDFAQVEAAAHEMGTARLKPIYEALGGKIGYERIRIVVAALANRAGVESA